MNENPAIQFNLSRILMWMNKNTISSIKSTYQGSGDSGGVEEIFMNGDQIIPPSEKIICAITSSSRFMKANLTIENNKFSLE